MVIIIIIKIKKLNCIFLFRKIKYNIHFTRNWLWDVEQRKCYNDDVFLQHDEVKENECHCHGIV